MEILIPKIYKPLFTPKRYKVLTGGRGSAKSETAGRYYVIKADTQKKRRILCTREYQNSISDSVYRTIKDIIELYKRPFYEFTKVSIINTRTNTEFLFKGLQDMTSIKSIKGITDVWVEEAQTLSQDSIDILLPTIREPESEILFTLNRENQDDAIFTTMCEKNRDDVLHIPSTYRDNPFFPEVLRREMEYCKLNDYEKYLHIWEGEAKKQSDALIFKNKFIVESFETPNLSNMYQERFFFGADWGFSQDPTIVNRMFIKDKRLYIDYEAWGIGVELDYLPALFDTIPEVRRWKIYADSARPETISHVANRGFNITAAEKWKGSVEDGIEYLKSFEKIVIHPRCVHTIDDYKFYSYKVDKNTNEILPLILDKNNHAPDADRYALSDYIKKNVTIFD